MGEDIWGGGIIITVAAGLWLVYLVPTWLQRREYLATERNALRLQQTMRILAETSEIPQEVRLEMTARTVAAQERILKQHEQKERAKAKAAEATAAAEAAAARAEAERSAAAAKEALEIERRRVKAARASRRLLRRLRAATSLVLLASLVALVIGSVQLFSGAGWGIAAAGALMAVGAFWVLGALARAGRRVAQVRASAPRMASTAVYDQQTEAVAEPVSARAWTPQPLPKPLYLSRGSAAAGSMASADAAEQLRRATARADLERRAAQRSPEVAPIRPVAQPAATQPAGAADDARFARMGLVGEAAPAPLDLDAALRRRRAG